MDINKNSLDMLKLIMSSQKYTEIAFLCDVLKISDRAVRYRLDKIDEFLKSIELPTLERQHSKGVRFKYSLDDLHVLEKYFKSYTPSSYYFSKEERQNFIKSELLQSDMPINSSYLMSVLNVSKSTVIKDLNEIQNFIESFHLKLVRKPNVGIYIMGDEKNKRRALSRVNSEMITVDELFDYLTTGKVDNKINILQLENLFADVDIDYLDKIIRMSEDTLCGEFSDLAYGSLLSHIVIMIKRIQLGQNIIMIDAPLDKEKYKDEIELGGRIIKELESHYNITIPEEEINYLVFHLLGAKFMHSENNEFFSQENSLNEVIKQMISAIETIYSIQFSQEVYDNLLNGLILHLRPAINRIKFNLLIKNPIFDDIMREYRELFENTKLVCAFLEQYIGFDIDDQEVSYIMLHFGAAIKNSVANDTILRVILVCGSGIGTANMLKSQLNKYYHVNIIATTGARNLQSYDRKSYDLIISTIRLPYLSDDEYIKVNVILSPSDFSILDSKLLNRKSNKDDTKVKLDKLISIIQKYADIQDFDKLSLELSMALSDKENRYFQSVKYKLKEFVDDKIKVCKDLPNLETAIRSACQLLEHNNSITSNYANSIIKLNNELGSYMAIAKNIAILHSNSPEDVIKTDFAILLVKNGIKMCFDDRDPIKLFIIFASTDGKEHYKILEELTIKLSDQNFINKIIDSRTKYDIMSIL